MFDYIEKIKTKPEHVKRRFAFMVSFAISFMIFAGWIASYSFKSSAIIAKDNTLIDKPVSSLTASVIGVYDDVKNIFFGSNKSEYSSDVIQISGGNR